MERESLFPLGYRAFNGAACDTAAALARRRDDCREPLVLVLDEDVVDAGAVDLDQVAILASHEEHDAHIGVVQYRTLLGGDHAADPRTLKLLRQLGVVERFGVVEKVGDVAHRCLLDQVDVEPFDVRGVRLARKPLERALAKALHDLLADALEAHVGLLVGRRRQVDGDVKRRSVARKRLLGHGHNVQYVAPYVKQGAEVDGMTVVSKPFLTVLHRGDLKARFRCWIKGHQWVPIHPDQRLCTRCWRVEEWRETLI